MRQRCGAARGTFGGGDVAIELVDAALAQASLQKLQAAGYAGQEIVEVVGETAGQLSDRLHLLALTQRLFRRHEFVRALLYTALQVRGKLPQRPLACAYFLEPASRVILPAARAQRGARETDQRRRMKRPLEERDIAERLEETPRRGIALQAAAALSQKDEREIRPFLLVVEEACKAVKIGAAQRLFGDKPESGAGAQLAHQRGDVGSDCRLYLGLA